jgi:hypothetical protein
MHSEHEGLTVPSLECWALREPTFKVETSLEKWPPTPGRVTNNIQFGSPAFDGEKSSCPVLSTGASWRPHTQQEKHAVAAEMFSIMHEQFSLP